jgi:hypothetical protein
VAPGKARFVLPPPQEAAASPDAGTVESRGITSPSSVTKALSALQSKTDW